MWSDTPGLEPGPEVLARGYRPHRRARDPFGRRRLPREALGSKSSSGQPSLHADIAVRVSSLH
jgi:hypothetical protein